nr:hypothetical protein [uncultured Agathobaculum sp.]
MAKHPYLEYRESQGHFAMTFKKQKPLRTRTEPAKTEYKTGVAQRQQHHSCFVLDALVMVRTNPLVSPKKIAGLSR